MPIISEMPKKKNQNYIYFWITKNYDFGEENMIMFF